MKFIVFVLLVNLAGLPAAAQDGSPHWIAPGGGVSCPVNTFTYFRKVVDLRTLDQDLSLQMAADSNAHLWINGHIARRKVTRYFEHEITTDTVDARPWLHVGRNTILILLHSWGPIVTFQRDGCLHSGVYVSSGWVVSDASWRVTPALEYQPNPRQIVGLPAQKGAHRIRFAQFIDGSLAPGDLFSRPAYDDRPWAFARVIEDGPWPMTPLASGVPGQQEEPVQPVTLLAEGRSLEQYENGIEPVSIEKQMLHAVVSPETRHAIALPDEIVIRGKAGETRYLTVDFGRPVHGFPFVDTTSSSPGPVIDFGYGELARSPLTGEPLVRTDGWLNPEAIVGEGYIDRYTARRGAQSVELPDERTARWWTLHVYFPRTGSLKIRRLGFISSQYPVQVKGSFHASDPRIAQIVRLSLEHASVSMSDAYVDTPGREDGQWLEDARLRAQLSAQWFGDVSLRQLYLRLGAQSQAADGTFHPFPPSNYRIVADADWTAEWVGALYDDYLWTGQTTRVNAYWSQVTAYWKHVLASVAADGLWIDDKIYADIRVGVHPAPGQSSGIVTAQLIDRLGLSIIMARAVGETTQALQWQDVRERMLAAFTEKHRVESSGAVPTHIDDVADSRPGGQQGYSQAAQVMAISAGLLPFKEAYADLVYAFQSPDGSPPNGVDRWNNPTYLFRALDALSSVGMTGKAVQHLFERFSAYLPGSAANPTPFLLQGLNGGPLPEYWISREDLHLAAGVPSPTQPIDASGSHGWNSVALVWLHTRLLGVTILTPGGSFLKVSPEDGGLGHIDGTTMTPRGPVTVSWTPSNRSLEVNLPDKVRAQVVLPPLLLPASRAGQFVSPDTCTRSKDESYDCTGPVLHFATR